MFHMLSMFSQGGGHHGPISQRRHARVRGHHQGAPIFRSRDGTKGGKMWEDLRESTEKSGKKWKTCGKISEHYGKIWGNHLSMEVRGNKAIHPIHIIR